MDSLGNVRSWLCRSLVTAFLSFAVVALAACSTSKTGPIDDAMHCYDLSYGKRRDELQQQIHRLHVESRYLRQGIEEIEKTSDEIFRKILERIPKTQDVRESVVHEDRGARSKAER
jgi:hypothetical protein